MALARARLVFVGSAVLGAICVILAGAAQAQVKRPLSGSNLRFQIGGELQIPIAPTRNTYDPIGMKSGMATVKASCVPVGGIKGVNPIPGAEVTTWPTGRFRILTSRFTLRGPFSNRFNGGKYPAKVIGVKTQNYAALQVRTYFQIQIPKPSTMQTMTRGLYLHTGTMTAPATFLGGHPGVPAKARKNGGKSGRTGVNTVSFCPGSTATVTMGMNPGCANILGGPGGVKFPLCLSSTANGKTRCPATSLPPVYQAVPGYMKYRRTSKMLGGPANGTLRGPADVIIGAENGVGAFAIPLDIKSADPAIGGSFGQFFQQNAGKGPEYKTVMNNDCGIVSKLGTLVNAKAGSNRTSASFGGPVTQGTLTIAVATKTGGEKYVLRGYDRRGPAYGPNTMGTKAIKGGVPAYKAGQGRLQLVVGSVSLRSLTGSNVNQGVLNFKIPEPEMAAGAAAALLVLLACHRAMNRKR